MGLISIQQPILEPLKEDYLKQHERKEELDFQVLIFRNLKDRIPNQTVTEENK